MVSFNRLLGAFGALLLLAGCASNPPPSRVASTAAPTPVEFDRNSYKLGSGDKIRIEVFGEPDLTVESLVDATGYMSYPLLGRLPVRGYTLKQIEQDIQNKLSQGYLVKPSVRVAILQFRPFYVTGQVNRVGAYPYVEGLTVEKAIAFASGMTPIASPRKIFVLRDGSTARRERVELATPVFPGDTIVVDEGLF